MKYAVNKTEQVAVEAETSGDAIKAVLNGEGTVVSTNYSASPRPEPTKPVQQMIIGGPNA